MTLHSEFPEDFKEETVDRIDKRWAQLNQLTLDYTERCIRYLFITNTGGALAIITYIGAAGVSAANPHHKSALVLFVAGIIYAGLLNVLLLKFTASLTKDWRTDSGDYYSDKIHYDELWALDDARSIDGDKKYYYLGYCAFAFFIVGALTGLWAFFA